MVGGQLLDLRAENSAVSGEALEAIHRRKTGALLAAALRLGGRAAGASSEQLAALDHFGAAIGLAFQITDDILDETAPTASLGKRAGRDAALGKSTYPKLFGLDTSRSMARDYVSGAVQALEHAGLASWELTGIAGYVLARQR
jgi:geranylgeranyl pyrophosphate synthase